MRGRALATLLLAASLGSARADEPHGGIIVLLGPASRAEAGRAREAVLVDALRIYTRDLGRGVRLGGAAPAALTAEALDRLAAAARDDGADVVVWFGERAGTPLLYALKAASLELRETTVAAGDTLGSARAAALKVRALLAPVADDTQWAVPPEAPPPRAGAAAPPRRSPPAASSPPVGPPRPRRRRRRERPRSARRRRQRAARERPTPQPAPRSATAPAGGQRAGAERARADTPPRRAGVRGWR